MVELTVQEVTLHLHTKQPKLKSIQILLVMVAIQYNSLKNNFAFSGRETVAIFGAHTCGAPHVWISLFPYTWTSSAANIFNNDHCKSMTGQKGGFLMTPTANPLEMPMETNPAQDGRQMLENIPKMEAPYFG